MEKGESPPSLKIYTFPSDKVLCVAAASDCYIERTSIWREKNRASQLLVSFIKPHNAVAISTVAGWAKQILICLALILTFLDHIPLVQHPRSTHSACKVFITLIIDKRQDVFSFAPK